MIRIKIKEHGKLGFSLFIPIWANLYGSLCTFAYKKYLQSPSEENEKEEFEVDLDDCDLQKELEIKMQADFNEKCTSENQCEPSCNKECVTEQANSKEGTQSQNKNEQNKEQKQSKKPLTEEQIAQAKEIGKAVKIALKELKKFCRKNGKLILVDVQSADGMNVTISAR